MTPADANDRQKWDARSQGLAETPRGHAPSPWLDALDDLLPRRGRALDVAGGAGRVVRLAYSG